MAEFGGSYKSTRSWLQNVREITGAAKREVTY
jgi:hypothetical protein